MKSVIFDEKRDIESVIQSGEVTQDSVNKIISSMAKYNFYIKDMRDEDNYNNISEWLKIHYSLYIETEFDSKIREKIKAAHKYGLLLSDNIQVYQKELDTILFANDIKFEKVLFTLLCIAKLQRNVFGYQNGKYKFALTNIFKLARVHIPSTDRGIFMHQLLEQGYIGAPFINSDDSRWVNFICEEGNPIIEISELDFYELAYVYLSWKNDGKGYGRCECCNRLMKKSKTKPKRFCESCSKLIGDVPDDKKVMLCVDCNKPVYIDKFDSQTCRCEECQSNNRRESYNKYNAKRRGKDVL